MRKLVGEDVLMRNPSGFQIRPNFESRLRLSNDNKNCHNFVTNLSKLPNIFVSIAKCICIDCEIMFYV